MEQVEKAGCTDFSLLGALPEEVVLAIMDWAGGDGIAGLSRTNRALRRLSLDHSLASHLQRNTNICLLGAQLSGKSTLLGHLMVIKSPSYAAELPQAQKIARDVGRTSHQLRFVVDPSVNAWDYPRRSRQHFLHTKHASYCFIDSPGYTQQLRRTMRAISQAEVALLVVDCESRAFEQTRFGTYGSACFLYGIRKVIVAMNKWDQRCLHFDGKIFEAQTQLIRSTFNKCGLRDVSFVPVCALQGWNLVPKDELPKPCLVQDFVSSQHTDLLDLSKAHTIPWDKSDLRNLYANGPSLWEVIERECAALKAFPDIYKAPRMTVVDILVNREGEVLFTGHVLQGMLKRGQLLKFIPNIPNWSAERLRYTPFETSWQTALIQGGLPVEVLKLKIGRREENHVTAGNFAGVVPKGWKVYSAARPNPVYRRTWRRGLICDAGADIKPVTFIIAMFVFCPKSLLYGWNFNCPSTRSVGYSPLLQFAAGHSVGRIVEVVREWDPKAKKWFRPTPATKIPVGRRVVVGILLQNPIPIDTFASCPKLGRFAALDARNVVGGGRVLVAMAHPIDATCSPPYPSVLEWCHFFRWRRLTNRRLRYARGTVPACALCNNQRAWISVPDLQGSDEGSGLPPRLPLCVGCFAGSRSLGSAARRQACIYFPPICAPSTSRHELVLPFSTNA